MRINFQFIEYTTLFFVAAAEQRRNVLNKL
jgi:hypothetical protein